jgi:hypothetical protein
LPDGRDKRFILCSRNYEWDEVADLVRKERPAVASRLPNYAAVPTKTFSAPLDVEFAKEVLGMTYIPWEQTVLESVDVCLRWEKEKEQLQGDRA